MDADTILLTVLTVACFAIGTTASGHVASLLALAGAASLGGAVGAYRA